jgi:hypothetical protein
MKTYDSRLESSDQDRTTNTFWDIIKAVCGKDRRRAKKISDQGMRARTEHTKGRRKSDKRKPNQHPHRCVRSDPTDLIARQCCVFLGTVFSLSGLVFTLLTQLALGIMLISIGLAFMVLARRFSLVKIVIAELFKIVIRRD